jgi:hypothetical protein
MPSRFPRLSFRVLTVFSVVAMPVLVLGAVIVIGMGYAHLRSSFGQHLSQVAEHTAATVDAYVFRRILDVSLLARIPDVRQVAVAGNREPFDPDRVRELDREWQRLGAVPAALSGLLENDASRVLADLVRHDPIYQEVLVTDRAGRLVAASNVTSDYDQADEAWWREAYDDGLRGRVSVGDVTWDQSARVYAVEIAVPVTDPVDEQLAGILKVVADVRELLAVVEGLRMGATGEATLVRDDGSIVVSQRRIDPGARYFAADLLRENLQRVRGEDPQFRLSFSARAPDGRSRFVGIAPSQLSASFPNLPWLIAVSQVEDELLGPVRAQAWYMVLVVVLTAVAVLIAALWFSMRLAAPTYDFDMHLVEHAKIPRYDPDVDETEDEERQAERV